MMPPLPHIGDLAVPVPPPNRQRQRIAELLRGVSIELSSHEHGSEQLCRGFLAPGTPVYVNFAPDDSYHAVVETAARLKRAGFCPVPHVAARYLTGPTQLDDFLARSVGAGVDRVLVIAGDLDRPAGPFHSSLELIETGLLRKHGIGTVGVAGYPEGHPKIATATLDAALAAKLRLLQGDGIAPYVVTQFCFDATPIISWLARMRAAGNRVPVRVGLAGPASIATLAKFAMRCGIGNSLLALVSGQTSIARLLVESGPEKVIHALAATDPADVDIAGLHLFTFGGVARTGKWLRAFGDDGRVRVEGGTA
ncbi:MAG: methylenetetrahydrofolate reductase [Alphaproteobacteria bacterium]|nr:methylenetetrahydrofolate reductase [Alphaproteobacteria bacterium]